MIPHQAGARARDVDPRGVARDIARRSRRRAVAGAASSRWCVVGRPAVAWTSDWAAIASARGYGSTLQAMAKPSAAPRTSSALPAVSYTHLRAHETRHDLVCRLL